MAAGEQILQVLARIEAKLDQVLAQKPAQASAGEAVADDRDLDGSHGDPQVRAKPRDWSGEDFKGRRYSETTPEFLDLLAGMLDYFAGRQTDAKKASYDRRDAARARGWARRLRAGWKPAAPAVGFDDGKSDFDDSGFSAPGEWT